MQRNEIDWPFRPTRMTEILGDELIAFAQAAMSAVCRMPVNFLELGEEGAIRPVHPIDPCLNHTKFCLYVHGDESRSHEFPGIPGGCKECTGRRDALARELLLNTAVHEREFFRVECHMGLQDFLYKIRYETAAAVLSTGQRLPDDGKSKVLRRISELASASTGFRLSNSDAVVLERYLEEVRPVDSRTLDILELQVERFLELVASNAGQLRKQEESRIRNEFLVELATVLGAKKPWQEFQRAVLPRLARSIGASKIAVFAGDDEIEVDEDAGGNVLAMRAHYSSVPCEDSLPHFNWSKSRIGSFQGRNFWQEAQAIAAQGVRGSGSMLWKQPVYLHSMEVGLGLKGIFLLGGMNRNDLSSAEQQHLEQLCEALLQSLLLAHQRARLKAVRARVIDKTDFLQHQVRSRLALLQSSLRSLRKARDEVGDDNRYLVRTHEQLNAVHNDLAELCHRAAMPGFSLADAEQLDWQRIQLEPVIAAAIDAQEAYARGRETDVNIHDSVGILPPIDGDPFRLRLVFYQLVNNSIKYSRQRLEGKRRWVSIRGAVAESGIRIEVENFGRGIRAQDLERIFDKGVRLVGNEEAPSLFDRRKGYGYGLYECRQIVSAHGGKMEASSRYFRGGAVTASNIDSCITTVSVFIPMSHQG